MRVFFFYDSSYTFAHENQFYWCRSEIYLNLSLEPPYNNYTFISPLLSQPPSSSPPPSLSSSSPWTFILFLFDSLLMIPLPQTLHTRSLNYLRVCISIACNLQLSCVSLISVQYCCIDAQIPCSNLPHAENRW